MKNTDKLAIGIYKAATAKEPGQGELMGQFLGAGIGGAVGVPAGLGVSSALIRGHEDIEKSLASRLAELDKSGLRGATHAAINSNLSGGLRDGANKLFSKATPQVSKLLQVLKLMKGPGAAVTGGVSLAALLGFPAMGGVVGHSAGGEIGRAFDNSSKKLASIDKLAIGFYKAATTKQAMGLLKSLGSKALEFGGGVAHGALSGAKGLINMPKSGIPGGFKMMANDAKGLAASGASKAKRVGNYAGLGAAGGAAGVGASKAVKGVYGAGENKGMAQGREQGLAEMLAQIQGQKQERGYLGNLLDAIMNKQQGV